MFTLKDYFALCVYVSTVQETNKEFQIQLNRNNRQVFSIVFFSKKLIYVQNYKWEIKDQLTLSLRAVRVASSIHMSTINTQLLNKNTFDCWDRCAEQGDLHKHWYLINTSYPDKTIIWLVV